MIPRAGEMMQVTDGRMGVPVLPVFSSPSPYPFTTDPCFTATAPYMVPPHNEPPHMQPPHIEPPHIEPPTQSGLIIKLIFCTKVPYLELK